MIRAVMLIAEGWQDEEGLYAYHRMLEAGWHVDVATPGTWRKEGKEVKGRPDVIRGKFGVPLSITKLVEELDASDYDVVLIPGGFQSPDILRMREEVLDFVHEMFASNKLVAMICHAAWVGISARIMGGIKATCYASLKDDIQNAGAYYWDLPVVVDGNMITAPHYKNNCDFMREVIGYFK